MKLQRRLLLKLEWLHLALPKLVVPAMETSLQQLAPVFSMALAQSVAERMLLMNG
jgi:hypothetical protein